jgi:outer membrane protein assembly factor BamB
MQRSFRSSAFLLSSFALVPLAAAQIPGESGPQTPVWGSWRGPDQSGVSDEVGLPETLAVDQPVWTLELSGRGTPVVADRTIYTMGYRGEDASFREVLVALDEGTGSVLWEHEFTGFLTDAIYQRFAIGSPTVDPETRSVYALSTAGLLSCFTPGGELVWERSLGEEYGRLTFPNGRTGAPLVVENLVIVHMISSAWGSLGPARDRFYAFDKRTGRNVWTSTPGGPPKDSSFSFPVVERDPDTGRLFLYAGLGGGHVVCVDVRTGAPVWRFQLATGGINSSPLLYGSRTLIAVHGLENVDSSEIGRMVALDRRAGRPAPGEPPAVLGKEHEIWRNDLVAFSSSPVLVGDTVYLTDKTGELVAVDAGTGAVRWKKKLATDQIHASPAYGDGKLYVPMADGSFHIVRVADGGKAGEVLQALQLGGSCLGAPAIANGRVYVHTTERLYAFGAELPRRSGEPTAAAALAQIRIEPADAVVRRGESFDLSVVGLDAAGRVSTLELPERVRWDKLPPHDPEGVAEYRDHVVFTELREPGAFVVTARLPEAGVAATARVRIVEPIPFRDGFDATLPAETGAAPPRPWWIGAGKKWEITTLEGENVLAKTLDNPLFQRTTSFVGHPDEADYTAQVDIRSDGNRRNMSSAGLVNQRYLIALKGNHQEIEVSSNVELFSRKAPFSWSRDRWYTLKTSVTREGEDTMVRVKCWPRDEGEPEAWTLEVVHPNGHTHGAPGIWGFVPQSRHRVYLDNLIVTPNS